MYLKSQPRRRIAAAAVIEKLPGVQEVLTRSEAARRFRLMPSRIGELVVLGDRDTVFGGLDSEIGNSAAGISQPRRTGRGQGAAGGVQRRRAPKAGYFQSNVDLARWLFAAA